MGLVAVPVPSATVTRENRGTVARTRFSGGTRGAGLHLLPLACLVLIVVCAGALRFFDLAAWPVFTDEDGYTQAAIAARGVPLRTAVEAAVRITLKPPLPFLVQSSLINVGLDPVVAGRSISATAGTVTTGLCYVLGKRVGGAGVGLLGAAAYAVSPMAVLHERMVLQDGLMSALALGAVLAAWVAVDRTSLPLGALAGLLGALAVQVKPPAVLCGLMPVAILVSGWPRRRQRVLPALLSAAGPFLSYAALILGPVGAEMRDQNSQLLSPFTFIPQNLDGLADSVQAYFPAGFAVLLLMGLVLGLRSSPRSLVVLAIATSMWIAPWIVLSRFSPARYYMPALPFVLVIAGLAVVKLMGITRRFRAVMWSLSAAIVVYWLGSSSLDGLRLLSDFTSASMSGLDNCQYRVCWPSGYGYRDAAQFIAATAKEGDRICYFIDSGHLVGAGLYEPLPSGVTSLGLLKTSDPFPRANSGRVLAMVDDGRDGPVGVKVSEILAVHPELRVLAQFRRPGSDAGVTVLGSPPSPVS